VENEKLKYYFLGFFDRTMNELEEMIKWKVDSHQFVSLSHELDKIIAFEKGDLLFIFNFNPTQVINCALYYDIIRALKITESELTGKRIILYCLILMNHNLEGLTDLLKIIL